MAEESGEKSFDATPHRRQQAREQGQVAFSQDLGSAVLLVAGVVLLKWQGWRLMEFTGLLLRRQLGEVITLDSNQGFMIDQSQGLIYAFLMAIAPLLGLFMLAGVLANILQIGFLWVPERLMPDISRINPWQGLQRIFSLPGTVRLGFGLFKIALICAVTFAVLWSRRLAIINASEQELEILGAFLLQVTLDTALWVGVALLVLALLDYGFQRWNFEQDLKMSHQEVREEMKELQGDPQIVARRRQVQRQMAMNRIGEAVPKADVIVTNPTELAVAIQYVPDKMAAPVVVAKGAGVLAQRIRKLGLEHNIPIIERKPLAQLLYKEVKVNHPVPDQSYAAVAEVLAYVYQLKGKKLPNMPKRAAA